MKPTKNKIFCNDCGRVKMLFETEKKANNFIKFNKEEIEMESGVAPQRSYFCLFCGGWHITSIKENIGMSRNEKRFENHLKEKSEKTKKIIPQKVEVNKKEDIKSEIEYQIKEMNVSQMKVFFGEKIDTLKKEIETLRNPTTPTEKEKLKELRKKLETIYIIRKQNYTQNPDEEKAIKQKFEEWDLWLKENGYNDD